MKAHARDCGPPAQAEVWEEGGQQEVISVHQEEKKGERMQLGEQRPRESKAQKQGSR